MPQSQIRRALQVDGKQAPPGEHAPIRTCTLREWGLAGHAWASLHMLQANAGMQRLQVAEARQASGVDNRGSLMFRYA